VKDMVAIVTQSFSRIHSLVIGPGLGRDSYVLSATSQIISKAILSNIP
jgi:NAD(P)H-hydrate repair Nnr-like enzyme with NAD(P)H-hydrate dehydratase domain